jgi:phosphoribosylformimino-5-aminoimidazole carboxamide ribonucleotide (ProFAR) isomerase
MLSGPDLPLIRTAGADAGIPVIASGGVASLEDVRAVAATGVEALVVGRALYEGRFTLAAAAAAGRIGG